MDQNTELRDGPRVFLSWNDDDFSFKPLLLRTSLPIWSIDLNKNQTFYNIASF